MSETTLYAALVRLNGACRDLLRTIADAPPVPAILRACSRIARALGMGDR